VVPTSSVEFTRSPPWCFLSRSYRKHPMSFLAVSFELTSVLYPVSWSLNTIPVVFTRQLQSAQSFSRHLPAISTFFQGSRSLDFYIFCPPALIKQKIHPLGRVTSYVVCLLLSPFGQAHVVLYSSPIFRFPFTCFFVPLTPSFRLIAVLPRYFCRSPNACLL